MVDLHPTQPPRLVAEAMGTGAIPAELSVILTPFLREVHKDGAALSPEKCSGRGVHSFLEQLMSGVNLIPGLEQVTLVRVYPDRVVHIF